MPKKSERPRELIPLGADSSVPRAGIVVVTPRRPRPYDLVTVWRLPAPVNDVARKLDKLLDSHDPVAWWGRVQLGEKRDGELDLVAHGLGYSLEFSLTDMKRPDPFHWSAQAHGDLTGRCEVELVERPGQTEVRIAWHVTPTHPTLVRLDPVLRPWFLLGHRLAMFVGERRLRAWVA